MNESKARELIMQSLGQASMCWEDIQTGIFLSTQCAEVGEQLLVDLELKELSMARNSQEGTENQVAFPLQARVELTITEISRINNARKKEWHDTPETAWSPAEWGNAAAGEMGELCNFLKKILRYDKGIQQNLVTKGYRDSDPAMRQELVDKAAKEIADTFLYLNLIADELNIDMYGAIVQKFNEVSERENLPQRIPE